MRASAAGRAVKEQPVKAPSGCTAARTSPPTQPWTPKNAAALADGRCQNTMGANEQSSLTRMRSRQTSRRAMGQSSRHCAGVSSSSSRAPRPTGLNPPSPSPFTPRFRPRPPPPGPPGKAARPPTHSTPPPRSPRAGRGVHVAAAASGGAAAGKDGVHLSRSAERPLGRKLPERRVGVTQLAHHLPIDVQQRAGAFDLDDAAEPLGAGASDLHRGSRRSNAPSTTARALANAAPKSRKVTSTPSELEFGLQPNVACSTRPRRNSFMPPCYCVLGLVACGAPPPREPPSDDGGEARGADPALAGGAARGADPVQPPPG